LFDTIFAKSVHKGNTSMFSYRLNGWPWSYTLSMTIKTNTSGR